MKLIFKLIFFLVIFFFNFSDDEAIALCSDVDPNDSPLTISCDTSGGNLTIDSFDATLSNGQTLAITNEDDGHIIIDNGGNFSYDGKNSITWLETFPVPKKSPQEVQPPSSLYTCWGVEGISFGFFPVFR